MAIHPGSGIKAILVDEGVLPGNPAWTVELGNLLDANRTIGIMDSGGRAAEPVLSIDYPTVQILMLGADGPTGYPDAYAKLEEIRSVLLGIPAGHSAYPELTMCNQIGHIVPLGRNDSGRPKFSLNFQLITEPAPTGHRVSA